ncbi:DUF4153 domain-containing protein [Paenisporosarcina sp. TG-14]|uniref:DUF4153 domain-containing protein n=1 Tax=Paenisporosarcina sp. TG-14 TaxID=1231057 RepID=UPI00031E50D0|nr:DUF4173 domain-containing protein [Paenisporosarcina sp. TG-14]
MDTEIKKNEWLFMLSCLGLGILAEISFFHAWIGVSYLVFLTGFYLVVFVRFRQGFNHRKIGLLVMGCIWLLAASYVLYDNTLFYLLNIAVIPFLLLFHVVLITSPGNLKWGKPAFVGRMAAKIWQGIAYSMQFSGRVFKLVFRNMDESTTQTVKRVLIGLLIGLPLLGIITGLLMSADAVFEEIVLSMPQFIFELNLEIIFRTLAVLVFTSLFFGILQVLQINRRTPIQEKNDEENGTISWNGITAVTILILLNAVYTLFTAIQFTYFFSDGLQEGYTYAEYARRGFFELIIVTLINWTILICCLKLVREQGAKMKLVLQLMYSLLVIVSGVMLVSAYQRLSMYEAAYGFTMERILAHAFMIFLIVIFTYTLIRVWFERLVLLHFYMIAGLVFYTALNVMHIEQIIVDENLERYERTGKIDIHYLDALSYTGVEGLIELYKMNPNYPELENMLYGRQQMMRDNPLDDWQSFNFTKKEVREQLIGLDLEQY